MNALPSLHAQELPGPGREASVSRMSDAGVRESTIDFL